MAAAFTAAVVVAVSFDPSTARVGVPCCIPFTVQPWVHTFLKPGSQFVRSACLDSAAGGCRPGGKGRRTGRAYGTSTPTPFTRGF